MAGIKWGHEAMGRARWQLFNAICENMAGRTKVMTNGTSLVIMEEQIGKSTLMILG